MPLIGVLLSGCGKLDGSEIHESVLTLYFIEKHGSNYLCMAPNMDQYDVINHYTQEPTNERRNVLVESARIARCEIKDLKEVNASMIDALIIPGGFGAAKNLSDFAIRGPEAEVQPEVKRIIVEMWKAKKPIGAICIAPATLTKALAEAAPQVTVGTDLSTASMIEKMGGRHHSCPVTGVWIDRENKLVTTPAYMLGPGITDVAIGIERLVLEVIELTRE